jgi:hypothetical protein
MGTLPGYVKTCFSSAGSSSGALRARQAAP